MLDATRVVTADKRVVTADTPAVTADKPVATADPAEGFPDVHLFADANGRLLVRRGPPGREGQVVNPPVPCTWRDFFLS